MVKISQGVLPLWLSRHIEENYSIEFAFVYQHLISTHQTEWHYWIVQGWRYA